MTRLRYICFFLLWFFAHPAASHGHLPLPAALKPDVDFWESVFTRYDSDEGVLHDARNLAVVYGRIDVPAGLSSRERKQRIEARRDQLKAVLGTLAAGKREGLTAEEARVLALWPAGVDNATLSRAAGQIRFQQGLSDRFRAGLERSGRWRAFIDAELGALGVPPELAALPHVESSYNPDARSHVGASGIWQFTRSTGRRFMRIDHVIDERNDPYTATTAAARLLAYNHSLTGNWPMAITAYNHGLGGVRRAMQKYGDTAYVDILRKYDGRTFGFASRNFYVAFLAAARVDAEPERYFPGLVMEPALVLDEAELPGYIASAELVRALGVTPSELAGWNPALQPTIWQGSKHLPKGYAVKLPGGRLERPLAELLALVPAGQWQPEQLPDLFHTIARGDTLSEIAQRYDTRVSTLVALNGLGNSHRIRAGQQLRLPAAGPLPAPDPPEETGAAAVEAAVVASLTEPSESAPVEEVEPAALSGEVASALIGTLQTALLSDPSDYSVADDGTIEVQPLETLGHYADWLGIRTQRLRDINGLAFRTPVEVGQRLALEFVGVDRAAFEDRRVAFHRSEQDGYFRRHVITGVTEHVIRPGESIWILALREYGVPVWLFRQYNPGLDLHAVRPGTTVRFPTMTRTGDS